MHDDAAVRWGSHGRRARGGSSPVSWCRHDHAGSDCNWRAMRVFNQAGRTYRTDGARAKVDRADLGAAAQRRPAPARTISDRTANTLHDLHAAGVRDPGSADLASRKWLQVPLSPARRTHLRGGLSPAALRRVQLFVEANLGRAIHLHDLAARAALSPFHFARAFKTSAGMTPRAYVEQRRIEHT